MFQDELDLSAAKREGKLINLQAEVAKLKEEIGAIMEILGGYVDGINILNGKILELEERLNTKE